MRHPPFFWNGTPAEQYGRQGFGFYIPHKLMWQKYLVFVIVPHLLFMWTKS